MTDSSVPSNLPLQPTTNLKQGASQSSFPHSDTAPVTAQPTTSVSAIPLTSDAAPNIARHDTQGEVLNDNQELRDLHDLLSGLM
ncbi:hypothetical protein NM688_g7422 [Phlebia brevispora]|uniref:Uncharacterized protein n=1 Tax=Phlebia brevispora TaxID=194682 RepID=A0ACC1S5G3_9APHY|nr:hypothetical protein NM688_g7422 [Phlebia brevispora]